MRQPPLTALLLALLLPLAACGGDGTGPEEEVTYHGTYQLRTINGGNLPFTLVDNTTQKVEILSGSIVVRENGTFTDQLDMRVTPVGGTSAPSDDVLSGTFIEIVGALRFSAVDGGSYNVAILQGGGLSQQINSFVLVYGK